MARPAKVGLDYFPVDVDIFDNEKLFDVQNKYGPLGETIFMRLLCLIYKNGYYYRFEDIDRLSAMLVKSIGNRWVRDKQTVKQVILYLAECNLFSKELMQENVLTSAGIQRRYLKAAERRKSLNTQYLIVDENGNDLRSVPQNKEYRDRNGINVNINPDNENKNATKKSKVKESKENKNRISKTDADAAEKLSSPDPELRQVCTAYQDNFLIPPGKGIADEMQFYLNKGITAPTLIKAIEKTAAAQAKWTYTRAVLNDWLAKGILTAEQVDQEDQLFQSRKAPKAGSNTMGNQGIVSSIDMDELQKFIYAK